MAAARWAGTATVEQGPAALPRSPAGLDPAAELLLRFHPVREHLPDADLDSGASDPARVAIP